MSGSSAKNVPSSKVGGRIELVLSVPPLSTSSLPLAWFTGLFRTKSLPCFNTSSSSASRINFCGKLVISRFTSEISVQKDDFRIFRSNRPVCRPIFTRSLGPISINANTTINKNSRGPTFNISMKHTMNRQCRSTCILLHHVQNSP